MLDINLPYHQLLPHLGGVKCVLDCSETKAVWHGDERQNLLISGVRYQDFYFDMLSIRYWGKYRNFDTIFDNFYFIFFKFF